MKAIGVFCALAPTLALLTSTAQGEPLAFKDPSGDDKGFGKATYPTGKDYVAGAFDLVSLEIKEDGEFVVFEVELASKVTDPWTSADWGGNGFSLQFVQVYLDLDGKKRKGERRGLPGTYVEFTPDSYWEKVVLISPQPSSKLLGEIDAKAKFLKKKIVVPERTEARGKKLIAKVKASAIGQKPSKKWGVQALMLSNEGYPAPTDLLCRQMNEIAGEHRFGGGCDGFGDPQVLDLLAGKGKGDASESELQFKELATFKCAENPKKASLAKISAVRL